VLRHLLGWSAEVAIRALYPTMAGGIDPLDTTGLEERGAAHGLYKSRVGEQWKWRLRGGKLLVAAVHYSPGGVVGT